MATDSFAFAATTMQCTFRKRVHERQRRARQEEEAAAFAAVNTDDGHTAVTRISRLFRVRKQFARTMVKSHQSGRAHIFDEGGADSRAEQQWRMAVENIRAMNLQRQVRVGVRRRC